MRSVAAVPGAWVIHENARMPEPDRGRIDVRRVAPDHAPRLELLDALVGRRAAHADLRPEVRVGPPAVPLEDLEDPGVIRTESISPWHLVPLH